jgi:hypothetical protein
MVGPNGSRKQSIFLFLEDLKTYANLWEGKDFILGCFYVIFNLEVGRKSVSLPVSSGLWVREKN